MSAQAVTGTGEEPDLSNLSLSRKEDFLLFAETPPRVQPKQLTRSQVKALSEEARADRTRRLRVWHANLGPFETPQLASLHEDMWDIIDSNAQDGDKVQGAIAVDAFPGLGKTTAVMVFAREFHLREIAEKGRFTPDGHERLPVCRVGLTGNTSMKDFNRAMLEFFATPGVIVALPRRWPTGPWTAFSLVTAACWSLTISTSCNGDVPTASRCPTTSSTSPTSFR